MFYVLECASGLTDYFEEHCYQEVVQVHEHIALVENPDTAGQLMNAFLYILLGQFATREEAEACKAARLAERNAPPVVEVPVEVKSDPAIEQNPDNPTPVLMETENLPWYGRGKIDVVR